MYPEFEGLQSRFFSLVSFPSSYFLQMHEDLLRLKPNPSQSQCILCKTSSTDQWLYPNEDKTHGSICMECYATSLRLKNTIRLIIRQASHLAIPTPYRPHQARIRKFLGMYEQRKRGTTGNVSFARLNDSFGSACDERTPLLRSARCLPMRKRLSEKIKSWFSGVDAFT